MPWLAKVAVVMAAIVLVLAFLAIRYDRHLPTTTPEEDE